MNRLLKEARLMALATVVGTAMVLSGCDYQTLATRDNNNEGERVSMPTRVALPMVDEQARVDEVKDKVVSGSIDFLFFGCVATGMIVVGGVVALRLPRLLEPTTKEPDNSKPKGIVDNSPIQRKNGKEIVLRRKPGEKVKSAEIKDGENWIPYFRS